MIQILINIKIEQKLLFQFLSDLEDYHKDLLSASNPDTPGQKHLLLLVNFLKEAYATTNSRLLALLKNGEITYDLLWALFKPSTPVFTICSGSQQPRCVEYVSGEEKQTLQGQRYFHLECRYFDYNGTVFGEAMTQLGIAQFRGVRRIDSLESFPFKYHPSKKEMTQQLLACGQKFCSLLGSHHREYQGIAFYMHNGKPVQIPVKSRIMLDAGIFRELHPNYSRPRVYEASHTEVDLFGLGKPVDQVKESETGPGEMQDQDLLICSPTIPGWILSDKTWGETSGRFLDYC
jgi:hypothetical protein